MVLTTNKPITLGNFEQRVLLELDNELSQAEIHWILRADRNSNLLFCNIIDSYEHCEDVVTCINNYLAELNLPIHKCALEGVAVLGYN